MVTPACDLYLDQLGRECGETDRVKRYLPGHRCPAHTPAALAGHPEAAAWATSPAPPVGRPIPEYGTATSDPFGRVFPGNARTGFIPRYPCRDDPRHHEHTGKCP